MRLSVGQDPGIGAHDVQPTELLDSGVDGRLQRRGVTHIGVGRAHAPAQRLGGRIVARVADVRDLSVLTGAVADGVAELGRLDIVCPPRSPPAGARTSAVLITVRGDASEPDSFQSLLAPPAVDFVPTSVAADDIAVVLYTSGTTADAKGALHSHRTLLAEARDLARWCRLDADAPRVFMASPLSQITGLSYGVLLPVGLGCEVVLLDRWDPAAAAEVIERTGCTFTVSATPFLRGLVDEYTRRGTCRLQTFVCGGADIPAELVRSAHRAMGTRGSIAWLSREGLRAPERPR